MMLDYGFIYQSPRSRWSGDAPEYICDQIGWGGFRGDYIDAVRYDAFFT